MFKGLSKEDVPVLYQIYGLSGEGIGYFKFDSEEYSLFSYEQEVLLRIYLKFDLIEISE